MYVILSHIDTKYEQGRSQDLDIGGDHCKVQREREIVATVSLSQFFTRKAGFDASNFGDWFLDKQSKIKHK